MIPTDARRDRASAHAACCALVRAYTPATDAAEVERRAQALWAAWQRARRRHWTDRPLGAWAPRFLAPGARRDGGQA